MAWTSGIYWISYKRKWYPEPAWSKTGPIFGLFGTLETQRQCFNAPFVSACPKNTKSFHWIIKERSISSFWISERWSSISKALLDSLEKRRQRLERGKREARKTKIEKKVANKTPLWYMCISETLRMSDYIPCSMFVCWLSIFTGKVDAAELWLLTSVMAGSPNDRFGPRPVKSSDPLY